MIRALLGSVFTLPRHAAPNLSSIVSRALADRSNLAGPRPTRAVRRRRRAGLADVCTGKG